MSLNPSPPAGTNHAKFPQSPPHNKDFIDKFIDYKFKGSSIEVKSILLVVVVLITTATYQTALSPPGGLWQDNFHPQNMTNNSTTVPPNSQPDPGNTNSNMEPDLEAIRAANKSHTAGKAILATIRKPTSYAIFVITNSLGFYTSVYMIYMLTIDFPLMWELHFSLTVLTLNYANCTRAVLPHEYNWLGVTCIVMFVIFATLITILVLRFLSRRIKQFKQFKANDVAV